MFELYIFFFIEYVSNIVDTWNCDSFQWLLEICHKNFVSSELKLQWKFELLVIFGVAVSSVRTDIFFLRHKF